MSTYSDASLILPIAPTYKAGKIYSLKPTDGSGDFDFTRSGNATRINSEGLIETVGSNVPRLNYPLIDGVVTSDSTPVPVVTSNYAISPDGTQNAERVQLTLSTNNEYAVVRRVGINPNATVGSTIYQSIYLKATDISQVGKKVDVYIYDQTNASYRRIFNHVLTNDWERIESNNLISFGSTATSVEYVFGKTRYLAAGQDGTSGTITSEAATDFLVWGAQLEAGSFPTSYIKSNSGSATTRSAETCNNAGDANTFNDSEGVLFVEISAFDDSTKQFSISDGTSANSVKFLYLSGNVFSFQVRDNFATQCTINKTLTNVNETIKAAAKYKQNDFVLWVNGFKVGQDTIGTVPIGLSELAYDDGGGGSPFYSSTKQIQYFPTALSDEELALLTSL